MITENSEYYISEEKLNSHYFIFDIWYNKSGDISYWFICKNCKLEMQITIDDCQTYKSDMNVSCDEMVMKHIIQ